MNIFWLDKNLKKCAAYHCDKHVVKMLVEYTQLLSTTIRVLNGALVSVKGRAFYLLPGERIVNGELLKNGITYRLIYKATHLNHPCAVWARESLDNYERLFELARLLSIEYTKRYHKIHKCQEVLDSMERILVRFAKNKATKPPLTMPDEFKTDDVVESYRAFYCGAKSRFAVWKHTKTPDWYEVNT